MFARLLHALATSCQKTLKPEIRKAVDRSLRSSLTVGDDNDEQGADDAVAAVQQTAPVVLVVLVVHHRYRDCHDEVDRGLSK